MKQVNQDNSTEGLANSAEVAVHLADPFPRSLQPSDGFSFVGAGIETEIILTDIDTPTGVSWEATE